MNVMIPDAIHICPACDAVCAGEKYCARCREEIEAMALRHAERANKLFSAQPRETGLMPEERRLTDVQKRTVVRLARQGVNAVLLAVWLWMAVDLYQRWRH